VFVASVIQHAKHMRLFYIMIFVPLWRYSIFPHYLMNGTIFGGEKIIEHKMCVLFSLQRLSGAFFIIRRNERDITT